MDSVMDRPDDNTERQSPPTLRSTLLENTGAIKFARKSLIEVIEWAIGGKDDGDALGAIQEIEENPAVAAWFARSFGYQEAQANFAAEVRTLKRQVAELTARSDTPNARLIAALERNNALQADTRRRQDKLTTMLETALRRIEGK